MQFDEGKFLKLITFRKLYRQARCMPDVSTCGRSSQPGARGRYNTTSHYVQVNVSYSGGGGRLKTRKSVKTSTPISFHDTSRHTACVLAPVQEGVWRDGGMAPRMFNLGTGQMWKVSFKTWRLQAREGHPNKTQNLCGRHRNIPELCDKGKGSWLYWESNRVLPARDPVTITEILSHTCYKPCLLKDYWILHEHCVWGTQ
jgi:hypothetical protein